MTQNAVIGILKEAIFTVIISAAPMLLIAITVGLLVSVFQATTQINEQTLAFVPKIVAVMVTLIIFGGFIISTLTGFATRLFESVNSFIG